MRVCKTDQYCQRHNFTLKDPVKMSSHNIQHGWQTPLTAVLAFETGYSLMTDYGGRPFPIKKVREC